MRSYLIRRRPAKPEPRFRGDRLGLRGGDIPLDLRDLGVGVGFPLRRHLLNTVHFLQSLANGRSHVLLHNPDCGLFIDHLERNVSGSQPGVQQKSSRGAAGARERREQQESSRKAGEEPQSGSSRAPAGHQQ